MLRLTGNLILIVSLGLAASCGNIKNLQYVQGNFDTAQLRKVQFKDPVIQTGDLLSITILSDDSKATAAVLGQQSLSEISESNTKAGPVSEVSAKPASSVLVRQDGNITFFKIGVIQAAGMTRRQLADSIAQRYVSLDLLKNPFVDVRYLNYKVTIVGEVSRPGVYSFPTDKVSIFDAIGLAGDITVYGKRNNVLVVREVNGERKFAQLDLSKADVFASDYYYLQQNDMVIVDVGKNKTALNDQSTIRNITVAASILATVAIFINLFK